MQVDATLIIAIGGVVTGILAFISSRSVEKRSARRDEITLLREEVDRLQKRVDELTTTNEEWRSKYDSLYSYVLMLRKILVDHNIDVPEMNIFNKDDSNSPFDATTHPERKAKEKKIAP
jgi:uncharacterized coiled-coil DUF342 family protein